MLLEMMKIFAVVLLINFFPAAPVLADTGMPVSMGSNLVSQGFEAMTALLTADGYSVQKGQSVDKFNDSTIKSSGGGPEQTSPEHGYFAVPLIVIGLAGILLYFSKFD